jgi:hypothetical protein
MNQSSLVEAFSSSNTLFALLNSTATTRTLTQIDSNVTRTAMSKGVRPFAPRSWDFGEVTLLALLIFGCIGNTLTIIVINKKRMRNTNASLFVTCMALSDIVLLVLKFTANMIKIYRIPIYDLCIFIQIIPQAASFISVWLVIITSAERAAAVLFPFKVMLIFSRFRCKLIIACMLIVFCLLSASIIFCLQYSPTQPYYCLIKGTLEGNCFFYYTYIFPWIKSAFGCWLPSLFGIILNLIIISALYRASNARRGITNTPLSRTFSSMRQNAQSDSLVKSPKTSKFKRIYRFSNKANSDPEQNEAMKPLKNPSLNSNNKNGSNGSERKCEPTKAVTNAGTNRVRFSTTYGKSSKEKQITIMLLTISISFIILTLPYSAYELLRKLDFLQYKWLKNRHVMRACMLLIDINHATNFIFYCLTAQRFRKELYKVLCVECIKAKVRSSFRLTNQTTAKNSSKKVFIQK